MPTLSPEAMNETRRIRKWELGFPIHRAREPRPYDRVFIGELRAQLA